MTLSSQHPCKKHVTLLNFLHHFLYINFFPFAKDAYNLIKLLIVKSNLSSPSAIWYSENIMSELLVKLQIMSKSTLSSTWLSWVLVFGSSIFSIVSKVSSSESLSIDIVLLTLCLNLLFYNFIFSLIIIN